MSKISTLTVKCSVYDCMEPAETFFACGVVKGKAKVAYTSQFRRLEKISLKGDCAVPICKSHAAVIKSFIKKIKQ